jgi:dihydrofolate reductase
MTKVTFDISMSLDGFITAGGASAEEPMGKGGERLHEWAFGADEESRRLLEEAVGSIGAVIAGRRTYDDSLPWWGADGPTGAARLPVVVVTHNEPSESPEGGVYSFVTGGIEETLARARAAAGGRSVTVMGGADVGRQYLSAGLVDELSIHLVPVVFGAGTPMFEGLVQLELEPAGVVDGPAATHLRYRVVSPRPRRRTG